MTRAYFISDLHLSSDKNAWEDDRQKHILNFFKFIEKDVTHLYLVGDFFDFWYEYKYSIPKAFFPMLFELQKLINKGVEIHYLAGNHDFALGSFFDDMMGIKTWQDEYTFELDGKKFYLHHGDGVDKKDIGYRLLKKVFRNKTNQWLFRWLHPDLGFPFARWLSGSSRKYSNQNNSERDESDYIEFAEQKFMDGFDYVLMGHRHNPLVHEKGTHRYINLGDWINKFSYALFDGKEIALNYFKD